MFEKLVIKPNTALLLTDRAQRRYVSKVDVQEGIAVVTDSVYYFTDARYFDGVKQSLKNKGNIPLLISGDQTVVDFLKDKGITDILVDYSKTTVDEYNKLKNFGFSISNGAQLLRNVRAIKSKDEIACIQTACDVTFKALMEGVKFAKVGITEKQLCAHIESLMFFYGAEELSFETIVAFNSNSAVPHHVTGDTKLKENDVILIDLGCKINGYCADLTRTFYYGTPGEKFLDVYNAVRGANVVAEESIYSGTSAKQADAFARNYLQDKGYGDYFTHSLGHGVGLDIHESPTLSPKGEGQLVDGMTFTVEPGVYLPGEFGVRIEDTVVLQNGKTKRFYHDDKKLIILTK